MTTEIRKEDLIDISENKPIEENEQDTEQEEQSAQAQNQSSQRQEPYRVPRKNIRELTNEEREYLIKEARQGINNEFYKVTFCKNGCTKITKKKPQKLSVSQKLISSSEATQSSKFRSPTMDTGQLQSLTLCSLLYGTMCRSLRP